MNSFIPVSRPSFCGNEKKYLNECIETEWVSSEGPFVKKFEQDFAQFIGMDYGLAVSSGSAALDIAIELLDLNPGDEVILPTFSIISPLFSILRSGAVPVFVDSEFSDWNIQTEKIEEKINSKTKALLIIHTYGLPVNMEPVMELVKKYHLNLIEDAAEAHGLKYRDRNCGSFGDISIFSFYANKNINTGEGGMILLRNENWFRRAKNLRNLSFDPLKPRFIHSEMGWNYRFTNLQAALGLAQLENLNKTIQKKIEIGTFYQERLKFLLKKGFQLPPENNGFSENHYWVFGIICPDIESKIEIMAFLDENKIGYRPFFWCLHEQPLLEKLHFKSTERFPVAERLARLGLYIPSGPGITKEEMERISGVLEEKYG